MIPAGATFEDLLRRTVREVVREEVRTIVREELAALSAAAPASPPEPLYLTPRSAAEIVGVSEKTLQRWVKDDVLPARRVGRLVRIARADLDALMEGGGVGRKRSTRTADEVALAVLRRGR